MECHLSISYSSLPLPLSLSFAAVGRREETSELTVPSLRSSTPSIPSSLIASVGW